MTHPLLRGDPLTSDLRPRNPPHPPRSFPVRSVADERRYQRCEVAVAIECVKITQTNRVVFCIAWVVDIKTTNMFKFNINVKLCTNCALKIVSLSKGPKLFTKLNQKCKVLTLSLFASVRALEKSNIDI